MKNILLIDAYHLAHRAYSKFYNLKLDEDTSVGLIYGVINILLSYKKRFHPCDIVMCYDTGHSRRSKICSDYKANRTDTHNGFFQQLFILKCLLKDIGIKCAELPDTEADDIIGSLSIKNKDGLNIIVSGDHDYFQLINDNTAFFKVGKNDKLYDKKTFIDEFGISPDRYVETMYISGDKSDNVHGIAGIGDKKALTIVKSTDNFDEVLKHEKVKDFIDIVNINRQVLTINKSLDVKIQTPEKHLDIVKHLFDNYLKFKSFLKRWEEIENFS